MDEKIDRLILNSDRSNQIQNEQDPDRIRQDNNENL